MLKFQTLIEALEERSKGNKGITFVNEKEDKFLSYTELFRKAKSTLYALQNKGLKKGSELILQIDNSESYLVTFWASILGGIVPVPIAPGNTEKNRIKVFKVVQHLKNPYLITDKKSFDSLTKFTNEKDLMEFSTFLQDRVINVEHIINGKNIYGVIESVTNTDIAFIQFTSGTTAFSKAVVLTHENLLTNASAIIAGTKGSEEDSSLSWMPLFHDMGLIGFHLTPLIANTNHYIIPTALFVRRPLLWLKKASEYKVKILACPNFGYKYFLSYIKEGTKYDFELSNVKVIFNGAEYISSKICNEFLNKMSIYGLKSNVMFPVYGMAEGSLAVAFPPVGEGLINVYLNREFLSPGDEIVEVEEKDEKAIAFVEEGYAVKDCEIKICDIENRLLGENRIGLIHIKGISVTNRYYNNKEETRANITADGWLNTGDLGVMIRGRLVFIGRYKDIIIKEGNTYYPHDIETLAEQVDGIELGRIAVCGVSDYEKRQQDIVAFIYFKKKIENFIVISDALEKLVEERLGLIIEHILPIRDMPKTTSGKIQRYKLIEKYKNGEFNEVLSKLAEVKR